ncbi:MAG: uracil-DNA glycosylase family protein [Candidatus Zixiibacteriota bacterium]
MNSEEYNEKIKALFEKKDCFKSKSEEICGPDRVKLEDGSFFPPPYTHIGLKYPDANPKILALAVNQNLSNVKPTDFCTARYSLRAPIPWYGPLENMERISQIIFKSLRNQEIEDSRIREFISFSNFVKCSTYQEYGHPTGEMVNNCLEFIIREIEILDPDIIICMGRIPFNGIWSGIRNKYRRFSKPQDYEQYSFRFGMNGKDVKVIRIYHYGDPRTLNRIEDDLRRYGRGETLKTKFSIMNKFFEVTFGNDVPSKKYYDKLLEIKESLNEYYRDRPDDKHTPPPLAKFIIRELVENALKE